jgi:integrase
MKKRRPHNIPLSEQALALLEAHKSHSGHREYVFPSDRNPRTHANSQTANMALKRMGFQDRLVSHGMRSMASTILNEHGWDPELIEAAEHEVSVHHRFKASLALNIEPSISLILINLSLALLARLKINTT